MMTGAVSRNSIGYLVTHDGPSASITACLAASAAPRISFLTSPFVITINSQGCRLSGLGARQPAYGPLNTVVPVDVVRGWLARLMEFHADDPSSQLAVMQMARRTDDRYRDVSEKLRRKALDWLDLSEAPAHFVQLVRDGGQLDEEEQGLVFGETLPSGLRLAAR